MKKMISSTISWMAMLFPAIAFMSGHSSDSNIIIVPFGICFGYKVVNFLTIGFKYFQLMIFKESEKDAELFERWIAFREE